MALNILLKAGIGDAWGVCFEYAPQDVINQRIDEWCYFSHHKYNIGDGRYSDDLQMHLAVAEVLLDGPPYNENDFVESFVRAFKRDVREGYAGRFYEFLQSVEDADDFRTRIKNDSEKSGASMRAACLGVLSDINDVMEVCAVQARTTHNTPLGIFAAQASSLMLHYLLYQKGERTDLPAFLEQHIPEINWRDLPELKIGHRGVDSVKAALRAVISEHSLIDMLKSVISCGGDTDTAATIALGVASCAKDVDQFLPQSLLDGFEDGDYGKSYVIEMDKRLSEFASDQGAPV